MLMRIFERLDEAAKSEEGGVAAEYGVIVAGVAVLVGIAGAALGARIGSLFDGIL